MRRFNDQIAHYAACHHDRRNIATHVVGVPVIVLAVAILLSRPPFELGGLTLTPAWLLLAASMAFYLALNLAYGVVIAALLALALWAAASTTALATPAWLACGLGLFVVGWAIQFLGHWYEGRKPAFVDSLVALLIGPLFLVTENRVRARAQQHPQARGRGARRPDPPGTQPGAGRVNAAALAWLPERGCVRMAERARADECG